jgi:hypothetical protein
LEGRAHEYDFKAVDTLFACLVSPPGEDTMPTIDFGVSLVELGVDSSATASTIASSSSNLDEFQSEAVRALVDNPTNKLFKFIHGPPGLSISISSQRMRQNSSDFYCCTIDRRGLKESE